MLENLTGPSIKGRANNRATGYSREWFVFTCAFEATEVIYLKTDAHLTFRIRPRSEIGDGILVCFGDRMAYDL